MAHIMCTPPLTTKTSMEGHGDCDLDLGFLLFNKFFTEIPLLNLVGKLIILNSVVFWITLLDRIYFYFGYTIFLTALLVMVWITLFYWIWICSNIQEKNSTFKKKKKYGINKQHLVTMDLYTKRLHD